MNGMDNGENVMKMAKTSKPALIQLFENLLWINSPKDWIIKSTYFRETLFVSVSKEEQSQKNSQISLIRRSFDLNTISSRENDLYGLAADCIDEMKNNIKTYGDIV